MPATGSFGAGGSGGGTSLTLNGLSDSVQDFATGTSGSDFSISSASGIHTFNLPTASGSVRGLLSSTDWTTFNGKQSALTLGDITSPTTGVSVSGGTGAVVGSGVAISVQTASGSQPGLLASADWTTFNNKAPAASPTFTGTITTPLTASRVLTTNGSSQLAASSVTTTTLAFLDASSSIQTQLDTKTEGKGNGANTRMAYWTDANTLSSSSVWVFTPATFGSVLSGSNSGGNVQLQISNSSATSSSNAVLRLDTANSSGGDALVKYATSGSTVWSAGLKSSDSTYHISNSATLGSSDALSVAPTTFNATFSGLVLGPAGAVGGPSFAFSGFPTFGMYYDSSNARTALAAGGVETLSVDATTAFTLLDFRLNAAQTAAAQYIIRNRVNDGSGCIYGGGTTASSGICLFGDSHATTPGQIILKDANATTMTLTAGGLIQAAGGSVTAPTFSFGADADGTGTGFYRSAANEMSLASNGVQSWKVNSSGVHTIGATTTDGFTNVRGRGIQVSYSSGGTTGYFEIDHSSNTSGSGAGFWAGVNGGSSGDAFITFDNLNASVDWTAGLDTSDSQAFVISKSQALGSSNVVRIDKTTLQVQAISGIRTKYATTDVSATPTATEFATACGTASSGLLCVVNDNNGGTAEYIAWSDGTNWFYIAGTKAL